MTICKHVYYSGRVQGVGFRYTAQQGAQEYDVAGFVRNLPDGRVEVKVEGSPEQVEAFLSALAQRMRGYVEEMQVVDEPSQGAKEFHVRY
jgi:acylphosphatase